jgi:hypothetical protein
MPVGMTLEMGGVGGEAPDFQRPRLASAPGVAAHRAGAGALPSLR